MNIVSAVFLFICSFLFWVGFLFRMQHWLGASLAFIGACLLSLVAVILYLIARYINKQKSLLATYAMYFMLFNIALGIVVTQPFKPTRSLLNNYHDISLKLDENAKLQSENSANLFAHLDPDDPLHTLHYNVANTLRLIDECKSKMVEESGGRDEDSIPLGKDNQDIAAIYVMNYGEAMRLQIGKINDGIAAFNSRYSLNIRYVDISETVDSDGIMSSWEQNISENVPLISVLASLSAIQFEIAAKENAMFNFASRKTLEVESEDTLQVDTAAIAMPE
ncbi:MAG: hypothetical protein ACKOXB_14460 [Flavobacteriales bacterium]